MLTKNALESAIPLVQLMDSAGVAVEPKAGTVLQALVQASRIPLNESAPDFLPSIDDIQYMANAQEANTGLCNHDVVMDEAAIHGIQAVQGLLTFARTVVAPVVIDLVKKVEDDLNNTTRSALKDMEVITVVEPDVLYNSSFIKEVMKYQEISFDDPALNMRLPTMATSDIRELMKTGTSSVDSEVEVWLAGKGEDFLINVWENIFQVKQNEMNEIGKVTTFAKLLSQADIGRDIALAVYLIARRLSDQGAPENTNMSAATFERSITSYRDQAALVLCREVAKMETAEKTGRLVIRTTDKKVWVNSRIYDAWINAGGSIEVLYGNILDGNNHATADKLNENAAGLLALWNSHEKVTRLTEDSTRLTRAQAFITAHFRASLATLSDEEKAKVTPDAIMTLYIPELRKTTLADLGCMYSLILRLVCRSRFYYSDAESLLTNVDAIMKMNPGTTDQEAMDMASFQYILKWVEEQFMVTPNK